MVWWCRNLDLAQDGNDTMSEDWLNDLGFEVHPVPDNCGTYSHPSGGRKLTLHTTESGWGSTDVLINLFKDSTLNAPQFQIDWNNGRPRFVQYLSLHRAGCAFRGGGCPTNGAGVNVQVEIVGYAAQSHTWPDGVLEMIGDFAVRVNRGLKRLGMAEIPYATSLTYYGQDAGFTLATANARQRLSCEGTLDYMGWIGHQHFWGNDHWDPGKLNVERILEHARRLDGGHTTGELFSMAQFDDLMAKLDGLQSQVNAQTATIGRWENDTRSYLGRTTVKTPTDPRQWLVVFTDSGMAKYHVKDQAELGLLLAGEMLRDAQTVREITNQDQIDALNALPEVG